MKSILFGLATTALLALPAAAVDMYCVDRDGRCMVVTVNGQKAVKLSKATKKKLEGLKTGDFVGDHPLSEARYEVLEAIRGDLEVTADPSAKSKDWFGDGRTFEVMVAPFSEVDLKTHQQLGAANDVRAGGAPIATVIKVLEGRRLPPGPYILYVRLSGDSNWDRMALFVQVAAD